MSSYGQQRLKKELSQQLCGDVAALVALRSTGGGGNRWCISKAYPVEQGECTNLYSSY